MVDADFVSYFLDVMLKNYFFSKRKMAQILGVTLRTVQTVFQKMPQQKGASLVFVNAICYCYKNHISVDAIYEQYNNEVKKHSLLISRLIRRSGLAKANRPFRKRNGLFIMQNFSSSSDVYYQLEYT